MQSGWYAGSEPNRRRLKASMNFREIIGTDTNLDVEMKTFQLLLLVQVEVEKKSNSDSQSGHLVDDGLVLLELVSIFLSCYIRVGVF